MNRGVLFAIVAYVFWGLIPIYWKLLVAVPAAEVLAHRMVWALPVSLLLLAAQRHWQWMRAALRNRRVLLVYFASALLLAMNWYAYIWAVNSGFIVETSLGYFITPLVNVLLGIFFLRERLRAWQVVAIAIAAGGVFYLTFNYGGVPWIGLLLAFTFGAYGLMRKVAPLNSLEGLTLESMLLFLPAVGYLVLVEQDAGGAFVHQGAATSLLLVLAGVVTAFPLLLFAAGARRITMTQLGILQYIAPTISFLLGVFLYGEPLPPARLIGFSVIWLALAIFTAEGFRHRQARRAPVSIPAD